MLAPCSHPRPPPLPVPNSPISEPIPLEAVIARNSEPAKLRPTHERLDRVRTLMRIGRGIWSIHECAVQITDGELASTHHMRRIVAEAKTRLSAHDEAAGIADANEPMTIFGRLIPPTADGS